MVCSGRRDREFLTWGKRAAVTRHAVRERQGLTTGLLRKHGPHQMNPASLVDAQRWTVLGTPLDASLLTDPNVIGERPAAILRHGERDLAPAAGVHMTPRGIDRSLMIEWRSSSY